MLNFVCWVAYEFRMGKSSLVSVIVYNQGTLKM